MPTINQFYIYREVVVLLLDIHALGHTLALLWILLFFSFDSGIIFLTGQWFLVQLLR